jgi:pimeloyl-ACP methyl ester carboxylesterase
MKNLSSAKKIVSEEGIDVYYWVNWDKSKNKTFYIIHPGSSMNHSSMENLEKGLNEKGFPTINIDPRGFGLSKAPAEKDYFSLEAYSDDLRKIVEQEGLENPSFIGHSFGFMPIVDYVSESSNAKNISGVGASYKFSQTSKNMFLFHLFNRFLRYGEYAGSVGTGLAHFLKRGERGYSNQAVLNNKSDLSVWLSAVDVTFEDIKTNIISGKEICKWDITQQLQKLDIPVLLVYGIYDSMVKPETAYKMQELIKGECNIEFIEATHSAPITQARRVLNTMNKYL